MSQTRYKIPRPGPTRNEIPRPDPTRKYSLKCSPTPNRFRSGPVRGNLGFRVAPQVFNSNNINITNYEAEQQVNHI